MYVCRKKALPRELLDDHFRKFSRSLSHGQLMDLSEQLTDLGSVLSSFMEEVSFPDTVQRFVYWNLIKWFYNEDMGEHNSIKTNYDWYSPSQAFRYSEEEFRSWIVEKNLAEVYFHRERACCSGRFRVK